MKYVTLGARVLLGLAFLVFGLDHFLHFLAIDAKPPGGRAGDFLGALASTGYLDVIKGIEAAGGALVLSGRFTPLGLVLLTPVVVNIALFDAFLMKSPNPIGIGVAVLTLFLLIVHRNNFAGLLARPTTA